MKNDTLLYALGSAIRRLRDHKDYGLIKTIYQGLKEDGFDITVASEVMAVLCLATSMEDFKKRIGRMVVAYTYDKKPVTVDDLHATGAVALIMKDALKPNLVQTLEGTPAIVFSIEK